MNAETTIEKCREIFTTFGLPQVLVSDNGRTFISKECQFFFKQNGIFHKCTAPYNPATNELAECFVQTLKQGLRKLGTTNKNIKRNLQKILFNYRLLPQQESGKSPAELMFGRNLNSRLNLIFPKTEQKIKKEETTSINLKQFKIGESVVVREYLDKNIKWRFGKVTKKLGRLHYLVRLPNDRTWKRHVNQMRAVGSSAANNTKIPMWDYGSPNGDINLDTVDSSETQEQTPTVLER